MRRNLTILAGVAAGSVAAALVRRRARVPRLSERDVGASDPRADELRRKLAEARESAADEEEFEAAGMGPETLVEDEEDVDAARRRVHGQARAAADEMRRAGGDDAEGAPSS